MDQLLDDLNKLTSIMVSELDEADYEQLSVFVEQRHSIYESIYNLKQVYGDLNLKQKALLSKILTYDPVILSKLTEMKMEASEWMERNGKIKTQKKAYQSAYQSVYAEESYYIDKKN